MSGKTINPGKLWQLIRGWNLLIIIILQYFFQYFAMDYLIAREGIALSDNFLQYHHQLFMLLVISTAFIAAAGYVINDIEDVETDKKNKPARIIIGKYIEVKKAKILYHSLNITGLLLGGLVFFRLGKPSLLTVHLLVSMMLYLYAVKYQCRKYWGNIMVAFSAELVIMVVYLFNFYRIFIETGTEAFSSPAAVTIVMGYAGFAFMFTLLREVVKDLEDYEGDSATGCRNWMVQAGLASGKKIAVIIALFSSAALAVFQYFIITGLPEKTLFDALFVIIQVLIWLYLIPRIYRAQEPADFHKVSGVVKLIFLSGTAFLMALAV